MINLKRYQKRSDKINLIHNERKNLGTEENFFEWIKRGLLQKFHNKYHTNNEILNAFPFRLRKMAEMTALTSSIQHCTSQGSNQGIR